MDKERTKREYDLRVLNCVSEGEYESRMAVWNGLGKTQPRLKKRKRLLITRSTSFSKI